MHSDPAMGFIRRNSRVAEVRDDLAGTAVAWARSITTIGLHKDDLPDVARDCIA